MFWSTSSFHITIFPAGCTWETFKKTANCPVCNRPQNEGDFTEVVVADVSAKPIQPTNFQGLFTKRDPRSKSVTLKDLCQELTRHQQEAQTMTRFVTCQLMRGLSLLGRKFQRAQHLLLALRQENTSLKQTINNQKVQYEEDMNAQKTQYEKTLNKIQKQLDEKETLLVKFRNVHASRPATPRTGIRGDAQGMHSMGHQAQYENPFKRQRIKEKLEEEERRQALRHQPRPPLGVQKSNTARNVIGRRPTSNELSHGSSHPHSQQQLGARGPNGHSVGIRQNLGPSSPFSFSGGSGGSGGRNKRRRHQSTHSNYDNGLSPSQAFGVQQEDGYSTHYQPQQSYRR